MEQPRIERVLRLMRLMSGNVYFTVEELAEKLETSYRSIYRYIDTFKECGFVVEKTGSGIYRLVSMPSQFKDLSNLVYFSEEEARLVSNLIENLDQTNSLKTGLHRKLAAIYDLTSINEYTGQRNCAANVQALGNAIRDRRKVVLKNYASSSSGVVRDRLVEPFGFTNNYVDIWVYDIEHAQSRLYKISRIEWVDVLTEEWEHEDAHVKGHVDAFRMQSHKQTHVRLDLSMRAKNLLCEEYPLAEADITPDGNGRFIYDSTVSAMEGIGRFCIGLAGDVKVIDSPELSDYIDKFIEKYYRNK